MGADVDIGASKLDEDVRIAWVETMQQAEGQHIWVDHARSDALTERSEERREVRETRLSERLKEDEALLNGGRLSSASARLSASVFCFAVEIRVVGEHRVVVAVAARVERRGLGGAHGHGRLYAGIVQHGHIGADLGVRQLERQNELGQGLATTASSCKHGWKGGIGRDSDGAAGGAWWWTINELIVGAGLVCFALLLGFGSAWRLVRFGSGSLFGRSSGVVADFGRRRGCCVGL